VQGFVEDEKSAVSLLAIVEMLPPLISLTQ
jgi:hypothetical protein